MSCRKVVYEEKHTSIIKTTTPKTIRVGERAEANVVYMVYDGCGRFKNFEVTRSANSFDIKVIARYSDGICSLAIGYGEEKFSFFFENKGVHYLKFLQPNGETIIDTLLVN